MARVVRTLFATTLSLLITIPPAVAQQGQTPPAQTPDPAAASTSQKLTKEQKKKMGKALKELDAQYKQWLNEDVVYIISPEERTAFLQLSTSEEREQFIEQFWLRRNPTPDTLENEAQEEHYRRIAYANDRFASGIPGWKTDRGRIYILMGKPAKIEHGRGEFEGRKDVLFEKWIYQYTSGFSLEAKIYFFDPTETNEFRLTTDESIRLFKLPKAFDFDLNT